MCDNTTAIAYVNNMGGSKSQKCDQIAKEIWEYCVDRNIYISAAHIPGKQNVIADRCSRIFNDGTEWQLLPNLFSNLMKSFDFEPDIDLFASRLNLQVQKYVSWQPDPSAFAVDAFSFSWTSHKFYAFPPFSMIGATVSKILKEKATGIIIIPHWPAQFWYPMVMRLASKQVWLPKRALRLPYNLQKSHPLESKLSLMAILVSGSN